MAEVKSRNIHFFDPYEPENSTRMGDTFKRTVLLGFTLISKNFDERYDDRRQWRAASSSEIAKQYNFPRQPSHNGSDCGVLICLYMWALIVDHPIPVVHNGQGTSSIQFIEAMSNLKVLSLVGISSKLLKFCGSKAKLLLLPFLSELLRAKFVQV